jgi:hypothetical protein
MVLGRVTSVGEWFRVQSQGAPEALWRRAARYLDDQPADADAATALARAATAALAETLAQAGSRAVALDLLAADALVTLALKARAAEGPAGLGAFAAALRQSGADVR